MLGKPANWDFQWGQIVGRAWADDEFKELLLADPAAILEEYDLAPPAGVGVEIFQDPDLIPESNDEVLYLLLPVKPGAEELSEDDLCSVGSPGTAKRCGCGWCHGCYHCHCAWCGCHHPPRPEEDE
jgi:hypothetical protein